ncbi:MAG: hypothetical protein LBR15_01425 [Methanobrevibacter sp.]|nr:hypothetical protein [Candidatus Methanovirga australis]
MASTTYNYQDINTQQTSGGWGGNVFGVYESSNKNLWLGVNVVPGINGEVPRDGSIRYYFKVFHEGTELPGIGTYLGQTYASNGSISEFSTNLANYGNIPDNKFTISIAFGGTSYNSRYNYFGNGNYLTITQDDVIYNVSTSIQGENFTVNNGDSLDFSVRLVDEYGYAVDNQPMELIINGGDSIISTTDNGYIYHHFDNISEDINVSAVFEGAIEDDVYGVNVNFLPSSNDFKINLNPMPVPDNNSTSNTTNSTDNTVNSVDGVKNGIVDWFGESFGGLANTGFPLVILFLGGILGIYFYYKKR